MNGRRRKKSPEMNNSGEETRDIQWGNPDSDYIEGMELLPGESIMPRKADIEFAVEDGRLSYSVFYPFEMLTIGHSRHKVWLSTARRAATGGKILQNLAIRRDNLRATAEFLINKFKDVFLTAQREEALALIHKRLALRKELSAVLAGKRRSAQNIVATTCIKTPRAGMFYLGEFFKDDRVNIQRRLDADRIKKEIMPRVSFPYKVSAIVDETIRSGILGRKMTGKDKTAIGGIVKALAAEKRCDFLYEHIAPFIKRKGIASLDVDKAGMINELKKNGISVFTQRTFDRSRSREKQRLFMTDKMFDGVMREMKKRAYMSFAKEELRRINGGDLSEVVENIKTIFNEIVKQGLIRSKLSPAKSKKGPTPVLQFLRGLCPDKSFTSRIARIEEFLKPSRRSRRA